MNTTMGPTTVSLESPHDKNPPHAADLVWGRVPSVFGMKVVIDPSMPPGTVEMRGLNTVRVYGLAVADTPGGKPDAAV